MKTFEDWLNERRGRAAQLAKYLGVHIGFVSNVKTKVSLMPASWIDRITILSNGELTHKGLLLERIEQQKARLKLRKQAQLYPIE